MKKLIFLSLLMLGLSACEKEKNLTPLEGTYAGTFRIITKDTQQISDFEVTLHANRFNTIKGGAGRGPFELLADQKVKFTDELMYTANFNWVTLLSGIYSYKIEGDSLILNKDLATPIKDLNYQYRLKKIK